MDYGDVIYDQPNNDSFTDKIEQLQYKACLAITEAIQATSIECLYNELGIESLSNRRWVESFVLSINYWQLKALSTFSILYHLVKVFMTHARNRDLFPIAELIVTNILFLSGDNLHQKYKTRSLLQFSKTNFFLL